MIYLDSNATTQVHPEVVEAMLPFLTTHCHNPSSGYRAGKFVKKAVEAAREEVAALIGAKAEEIAFTGCGTESNNMVLKSLARVVGRKNSRVVTSAIEHSAVLRPCEAMEAVGFEVLRCGVDEEGRLRVDEFAELVDASRPGFASVMWANNETGVTQPIAEACAIAKEAGWGFHTDAIQAVGKIPVDVREVPVDFLSISGHKFHAPKGVGALFLREGLRFEPMLRGGGQEGGRRSGTENVASIVGLGKAAALMREGLERDGHAEVRRLRDHFEERLVGEIEGVRLNGSREHRAGNIVHASFERCEAAGLLILLDEAGVQCSAGSACMTGKQQPSHVQKAMGYSDERARSSLRISLSIFTSAEEVDAAVEAVRKAVAKLRSVQGGGVGPVVVYGG
ncbi:MAG: cysteine desulfurase family protein [Verrucomicrobia bacterium]|nr:cysteine desulfurase family protein [Verrucomicrobiota bacterium]